MDVNKVTLIGNLVRDPEARNLPSGQAISTFSLATNYSWRDIKTKSRKESTEFHDIVAWGKLGEIIQQYVKKGSKVYIEGRLHRRSWEDKAKQKHYRTEVVAENLVMLGHRSAKTKEVEPTELPKDEVSVEEIPVTA
ncbi:MAG: single-stranded DNA-binding protein [Candidatus Nomurabacteria bacterium]|nr:MAG: single-stranded DNA-binding protein [Candidatus Nomurabacteria bacterium]